MNYKKKLADMIEMLVSGKWSVPQFKSEYYDFYLEKVPDEALSESDAIFFGSVQEKLDWTDASPDKESQQFGWLNHKEFIQWVQTQREHYLFEGRGFQREIDSLTGSQLENNDVKLYG